MNNFLVLLINISILFNCYSQELIQDGGFEEITFVKKDTSWSYDHWKSLLYTKKFTSDYASKFSLYKEVLLSQDTTKFLFYKAHELLEYFKPFEGDSRLGIGNISTKNLWQGKLLQAIVKDSFYRLSFMYKILSDNIPPNKVEFIVANNIGLFFSEFDLADPKTIQGLKKLSIHLPFHFYINNFTYDKNKKWIPMVIDFIAKKNFNYIIIGNNDMLTSALEARPFKGTGCQFDNFSLQKIDRSEAKYFYKPVEYSQSEFLDLDNSEKVKSLFNKPAFQNLKLKNYYKHIDKAENLIIDKKHKEALVEYCNAFNYKVPFFRDFMNAGKLITKFKLNDSLLLRKFLITSKKYAPYKYSVKDRVEYWQKMDTIYKTSYLDFFKSDPSLENISFAGKIDSTLIKKIFSMSESDQGSRNNRSGIKDADESNYESVLKLYKEYKEISELTIGQWPMQKLKIMFLHFSRYENNEWIDLLQAEVMKGNFDNRTFASLVDSYIENNIESDVTKSYFLSNIGYAHHTKYCIPSIEKKLIDEVNKRRAEIYLDPVESQQRKQLYNFRNGYGDFMFYSFFSYDPMHPDSTISEAEAIEREKKFIENLKVNYPVLKIYHKNKMNYDIDFK
jgi:hypothetical protein